MTLRGRWDRLVRRLVEGPLEAGRARRIVRALWPQPLVVIQGLSGHEYVHRARSWSGKLGEALHPLVGQASGRVLHADGLCDMGAGWTIGFGRWRPLNRAALRAFGYWHEGEP